MTKIQNAYDLHKGILCHTILFYIDDNGLNEVEKMDYI